ncbi:Fic family protein [Pelagimonas sp. KU-00592-HH]|uniref:Fic family protein n=1 Tax=Pelagimonas sp. KU-00592-HH TaxID=3127651 RepID=UPI00333F0FDC
MAEKHLISINNTQYDATDAVSYHIKGFPPGPLDPSALIGPQTDAVMALVQYDTELRQLPRSELLLAPLRARDAVVSSRMEGTISTLEEVLRLEADSDEDSLPSNAREADLEVALYARALRQAEHALRDGYPFSGHIIQNAHRTLLYTGRGARSRPGEYKIEQNYIGNRRARRIDYIPIAPEQLLGGLEALFKFGNTTRDEDGLLPLLRVALVHAEFEALHPFEDGNGRLGRMLIPLLLWRQGLLSAPHFFVSDYFEKNKDEYIERLRRVSENAEWTEWCVFFCKAIESQAKANIETVGQVRVHYEHMREVFRDLLRSRWSTDALDYIFANPIFRNNRFKRNAGIPAQTANAFTNKLVEAGLLRVLIPPSGRAPGMYAFPSLLEIVAEP